jgi:hypothetical protein
MTMLTSDCIPPLKTSSWGLCSLWGFPGLDLHTSRLAGHQPVMWQFCVVVAWQQWHWWGRFGCGQNLYIGALFGVYECLCVCRLMLWSQGCYVLFSIHLTESTMTWKGILVVKIFVGVDIGISYLELFIWTKDSSLSARSHLFGI